MINNGISYTTGPVLRASCNKFQAHLDLTRPQSSSRLKSTAGTGGNGTGEKMHALSAPLGGDWGRVSLKTISMERQVIIQERHELYALTAVSSVSSPGENKFSAVSKLL